MRPLAIDHLGIAVRDLERAVAAYEALGFRVEERHEVPTEKVRAAFLPVGESRLELLEPTDPSSPLARFLDDGHLRLDNNVSELELRRQVIGRKNWLFCGSDDGAHGNATATSLIASCQLHGVEPWAYLRDVLTLLPTWPLSRAIELSPKAWNETETEQRLRALRLLGRDDDGKAAGRDADDQREALRGKSAGERSRPLPAQPDRVGPRTIEAARQRA